jgi:hypothetical protein
MIVIPNKPRSVAEAPGASLLQVQGIVVLGEEHLLAVVSPSRTVVGQTGNYGPLAPGYRNRSGNGA